MERFGQVQLHRRQQRRRAASSTRSWPPPPPCSREGRTLATYGLESGPLGYLPLRRFLVEKLKRTAGIACTAEEILVTSGSLQALDLVNGALLASGDTVLIEQESYQVRSTGSRGSA